ncbi:hypothetical protein IQ259_22645 [Fortiea sp. LEGE XX443]|uniref:HMA2 domain-containing protein n=1 Tax=Fortiea sp. LEGE XX443 TaxID=1828611 RepID=UPI001882A98D|nr:hypothetical protein [Fortiea sp. LEGE XX443]MBE9007783.1 hypothetical protein [Fortiea sp. LEGE XX443]
MNYINLFSHHENNQVNVHGQTGKTSKHVTSQQAPSQQISYSVAHAIAGRIRFRIPRLSKDSEYANKLKLAIESKIKNAKVRINPTASSVVIHYPTGLMSDEQMRSHLVNLIQTAPNIALPTKVSTKTIVGSIFDAWINLMDGLRNLNKARTAIQHQQVRRDPWERLLSFGESMIKGLKSTIVFILPNKRWQSQSALNSA